MIEIKEREKIRVEAHRAGMLEAAAFCEHYSLTADGDWENVGSSLAKEIRQIVEFAVATDEIARKRTDTQEEGK